MDSVIAYNTLETFQIQVFNPVLMCLIFSIVIHAVKEATDAVVIQDVLPSSPWTNFAISVYNGGHGGLHRLLTTLYSTRLPNLHKVFNECQQLIAANRGQRFTRTVLDVCCKRLFFPVRTGNNSSAKPQRRFIKIYFHNKGIDKVNLTNILHNKLVKSKVPIYFQEQDPPLISYKYTNTISRSVFNYNQTVHNVKGAMPW